MSAETRTVRGISADPDRARFLDDSLRLLVVACHERGRALPPVYAAVVDDMAIELLVAPVLPGAPVPWVVVDDGRRWRIDRSAVDLAPLARHGVPAPYPGLVSVGRNGHADVLIDLEAAGGPVCVVGDPGTASEVVTAVAAELAVNPWSDRLRVVGAGLPDTLHRLGSRRLCLVDRIEPLVSDLTRHSGRFGLDVVSGRARPGEAGGWVSEYVVLATPPAAVLADRLVPLASAAGRSPLGVVCPGEIAGARWRMVVDANGTLELPALGLRMWANRLSPDDVETVAGLIGPARRAAAHPDGPASRPVAPRPPVAVDEAALTGAPIRVYALGPAVVRAGTEIAAERRMLATEVVVHLALRREGVHPTTLAAALWPRGVTTEVRDATFAGVRGWLGVDSDGRPHLRTTTDGRLQLGAEVVLDWDVVCTLLGRACDVGDPEQEIELLRRALRVARGPVQGSVGRPTFERVAADVLVDTAHRLSTLARQGGDIETAEAAAWAGLRIRPVDQPLWCDVLFARYDVEGASGAAAAAVEMRAALAAGAATLTQQTTRVVRDLTSKARFSRARHR